MVTVLMAVFNGGSYLKTALDSILSQSLRDFELLVIDDASTDGTAELLGRYAVEDRRVRVLHNGENIGLTASLTFGLKEAKGRYIARLDADDVARPSRLAAQVRFLEERPDVDVVGTWATLIDDKGNECGSWQLPQSDGALSWLLLFNNAFVHSSVMFRKDAALSLGGYSPECKRSQDYDLWLRMAQQGLLGCIPEELVHFRRHDASITALHSPNQVATHNRSAMRHLAQAYGVELSEDALMLLRGRMSGPTSGPVREEAIRALVRLFRRHTGIKHSAFEDRVIVRRDAAKRMWRIACPPGLNGRLLLAALHASRLDPRIPTSRILQALRPVFRAKNVCLSAVQTVCRRDNDAGSSE